jgi:hypothetical protein
MCRVSNPGKARQEPEIAPRSILAMAYQFLSRMEKLFFLARRWAKDRIATEIQPEKILKQKKVAIGDPVKH